MCKPFKIRVRGEQGFPTPDRTIGAIACPVKCETDHTPVLQTVISHTGSNVRVMMLHTYARNIQTRTPGVFSRKVIWMQIIRNQLRFHTEDLGEMSNPLFK